VLSLQKVADLPVQPDAAMYCHAFPVDAAFGSDPDVDNKPSQEDNCPMTANPGQDDEDSDCRGDACDSCQWLPIPNPDMGDGDGDSIGDGCDPSPVPNMIDFDGFNGTTTAGTFHTANVTFTQANGSITHSTQTGYATVFRGVPWGAGQISFGMHVATETRSGTANFFAGAWVLGYIDAGQQNGVRVGLARDTGRYWLRIELVHQTGTQTLGQYEVPGAQLPDQLRFTVGYDVQTVNAKLELMAGDVMATAPISQIGASYAGLVTIDTVASWDYWAQIN